MSIFSSIGKGIGNLFKGVTKVAQPILGVASAIPGPWQVPAAIASGVGSLVAGGSSGGGGSLLNSAAIGGSTAYSVQAAKAAADEYAKQAARGINGLTVAGNQGGEALTYGRDMGIGALRSSRDLAAGDLAYGANMGEGYLAQNYRDSIPLIANETQAVDNAYMPLEAAGGAAADKLSALYGLNGPQAQAAAMEAFKASPGYQFRLNEGNRQINNAMASRGRFYAPDTVNALNQYGQDVASGEFNNYLSGIGSLVNSGQAAANNRLTMRGSLLRDRLGLGERTAGGIADLRFKQGTGNAQLNSDYGRSAANIFGSYGSGIGDLRLKVAGAQADAYNGMGQAFGLAKLGQSNAVNEGVGNLISTGGLNQMGSAIGSLFTGKSTPPVVATNANNRAWGAYF